MIRDSLRRLLQGFGTRRGFCRMFGLLLLCLGLLGCRSTENEAPPALASVVLHGNTPGQISQATQRVFAKHGYITAEARLDQLEFEKKGTRLENLEYGSWMGETPVWVRVKVSIVPVGERAFRLECRAFLVTDHGSSMEEERKIGRMHAGPYRKLLEEVAASLGNR